MLEGDQPKKATQRGKETDREVGWKLAAERKVGKANLGRGDTCQASSPLAIGPKGSLNSTEEKAL